MPCVYVYMYILCILYLLLHCYFHVIFMLCIFFFYYKVCFLFTLYLYCSISCTLCMGRVLLYIFTVGFTSIRDKLRILDLALESLSSCTSAGSFLARKESQTQFIMSLENQKAKSNTNFWDHLNFRICLRKLVANLQFLDFCFSSI